MSKLEKYLSAEAISALAEQIKDAGGNEVFFVGYLDDARVVRAVEVFARGNEFQTPALLQVAEAGNVVIHNHPSGVLRPSHADIHIASILGNDGVGFYIVDNRVTDLYVMVEPFAEKQTVPLNADELAELLSPDGPIAASLEEYEFRPQQIEMLRAICDSFNEGKIAVIEAGTGTGKTLAYLLPAITYAVSNKERVVVSTNTINLQEQLVNKDLPFLASVLETEFSAVLVKGRTNYACKRKLAEANADLDLFAEERDRSELRAILQWAKTTKDGSKSDLNFVPRSDVWERIQSESDTSLKTKCPFYSECFFYTARRKAATANILVANHHLLFSDLALRSLYGASENAVLPGYRRIIFDEAHNLEEVATNYFGIRLTYLGLLRMLRQLYRKKKDTEKGLLYFLSLKLTKLARRLPHEDLIALQGIIQEDGIAGVEKLSFVLSETMEKLFEHVRHLRAEESRFGELKLRLTAEVTARPEWQNQILPAVKNLVLAMRRFTARLNRLLAGLEKFQSRLDQSAASLVIDLRARLDRLDLAATNIEQVLLVDEPAHVRWLEVKQGYNQTKLVRLSLSPLEVAALLHETVYKPFKSVVMTSATLTVAGRFDYLRQRLGLDLVEAGQVEEKALPAPFDYESQALVAIPIDIPDPRAQEFENVIFEFILEAIKISRGRAFVLFTAYGLMNRAHARLKGQIEALGYNLYKQGEENRHRLLERFKQDVSSVLFGTDSFWEGVDVHGEALESVIITKLPFRVPSEPIVEARVEAIARRGGNAFLEYIVPLAAIKFKQGFGRLIRRKTDRGVVLILDKRVVQKSYGRAFLDSLPRCRFLAGRRQEVLAELQRFYGQT